MLRRLRLSYMLYNFFKKKELQHNVPLYKKLGLNKKYYSSVSSKDFTNIDENILTKRTDKSKLKDLNFYKGVTEDSKDSLDKFWDNGFCVIEQYKDEETVDKINEEIEKLQECGQLDFQYGNKLMFAVHKSAFLKNIWEDKKLNELLDYLIGGSAKLFQSINFINGSEQHTHSDSIHMTTFPLGGLLGVWLALEDIDIDSGPLHYYPGSHRLPYYLNSDYNNDGNSLVIGPHGYDAYEKMLATKIKNEQIEKKVFLAKKGDLFIWHANLLHGGEPQLDKNKTRKSMVMHYFDANRICYHEISQRPAFIG